MSQTFVHGSIMLVDDGRDIIISHTHTPSNAIRIECNDRFDLLRCLLASEGVDQQLVALIDPEHKETT